APDRGGRQILVKSGPEDDLAFFEMLLRAPELQIEAAKRRAAVTADEARRIQAGAAVALLLHQRETHDCLRPGKEHTILCEVVLVVERHPAAGHPVLIGVESRRRVRARRSTTCGAP